MNTCAFGTWAMRCMSNAFAQNRRGGHIRGSPMNTCAFGTWAMR
jgi:hypothetical protein